LLSTAGYYAIFVVLGLATASLGPTLPGLAEHTRSQLSEIGFVFTARALGYLLGSYQSGRTYDRLPGHPILAGVLVVLALMLFLVPLVEKLWLLTVIVLVLGAAEGALDVGGNALLVWLHGSRVGPYMNGLHFFFGVGALSSPIIIARAIALTGDIVWAYWVLALLALPVAVWMAALRHRTPPRPDGAAAPARAGQNTGERRISGAEQQRLVLLLSLFLVLYVGAEATFGGWIYTYAFTLGLGTKTSAAYLTSGFWGALMVGRLLSIPLAARYQPRSILLADLAGCVASVALLVLGPRTPAVTWAGSLGLGLSMASIFPTVISLAESRMAVTGRITAWFFVGASAGGMSVPWLIGQLFERVGPQSMMAVILADLAIALGLYFVMVRYAWPRAGVSLPAAIE
jgi:FHS family Na+ dependent glucose MFS transporter 1